MSIASLSGTFVYKLFTSKKTMLSSEFNLYFYIRFHIPGCFSVGLKICTIDFIEKFSLSLISFSHEVPGKERTSRGGVSFLFT